MREDDFEQHVAIKWVDRGHRRVEVLDLFFRERQILTDPQHPNIGWLLDGSSRTEIRVYGGKRHLPVFFSRSPEPMIWGGVAPDLQKDWREPIVEELDGTMAQHLHFLWQRQLQSPFG
ncbi:MAG: hypothetical protein AAGD01_17435 [Acidobacteriota bacterium]